MEDKNQTNDQALIERKNCIEIVSIIIMSIATVAAAWSSSQAAKWGGEMVINFNQASEKRTESVRASLTAGQLTNLDIFLFNEWLVATYEEDEELADFYLDRMRNDFRPALDAWLASKPQKNPDAKPSPFSMQEYTIPEFEQAIHLEQEASQLIEIGMENNQQSDDYIANTVIMASVLFFAGISNRFKKYSAQVIMIIFSLGLLMYGVYHIIIYPVSF
jgi:hypothetical protein